MKIAIIGAGWYGCHLASTLREEGCAVQIFEASGDVFTGASGCNQNRLHLGFHYPRSALTRRQCASGYDDFLQKYARFSRPVTNNLYAVARRRSLLDFETYLQILRASRLKFELCDPAAEGLTNVTGALRCTEQLVDTQAARDYFRQHLASSLRLKTAVTSLESTDDGAWVNGESFDLVLNCTWQTFIPCQRWNIHYEPFLMLHYEGSAKCPALLVLDGPFSSFYPYRDSLFTLYSVRHSHQGNYKDISAARARVREMDSAFITQVREKMELEVRRYFPSFTEMFRFQGAATTVKTKVPDRSDRRSCEIKQLGRVVHVYSGKLHGIFHAERRIKRIIQEIASGAPRQDREVALPCSGTV